MSWVDKAHKDIKIHRQIESAMKDPRYQIAEKKKLEEMHRKAFDCFLLISTDYLYRLGFRKKRLLKFIEFVVYQMHCIEEYPEYFQQLNEALAEETGIDILENVIRERELVKKQTKEEQKN